MGLFHDPLSVVAELHKTSTATTDLQTFTQADLAGTRALLISVAGAAARVSFDAANPSATHGLTLPIGVYGPWPIAPNAGLIISSASSTTSEVEVVCLA